MASQGDDVDSKAKGFATPSSSPPKARLTTDGSGELRVVERVVRQSSSVVQLPMLTRANYIDWALVMRVQLQAQGLWEAIEPGICEYRVDREALGAILRAVPPEMLRSLAVKDTAKEVWDALKTLRLGSERVREARAQTRRTEFENLQFKDGEKVKDFAMRLTGIMNDLEVLGDGVTEHKAVLKFLRCVPKQYKQLARSIQSLLDLKVMTIEELTGRFLAEEECCDMEDASGSDGSTRLLLTKEEWTERMKKKNRSRDKKKIRCFNCQKLGHFAWECLEKGKEEKFPEEENEEKALFGGYASDEPALL